MVGVEPIIIIQQQTEIARCGIQPRIRCLGAGQFLAHSRNANGEGQKLRVDLFQPLPQHIHQHHFDMAVRLREQRIQRLRQRFPCRGADDDRDQRHILRHTGNFTR